MKIYFEYKEEIIKNLKIIWDYMNLNMTIPTCDVIIGCGCSKLDVPKRCSELYKDGYAPLIVFTGGFGKGTLGVFEKSEAEIYRDLAIKDGVPRENILIENKSTNTGDNFRFSLELLKSKNIKADKILIVNHSCAERRNYSSASAIIKDKEIYVTSPVKSFEDYIKEIEEDKEMIIHNISIVVGDLQRFIIYPQFGWQIENEVPDNVIDAYYYLKKLGFDKYIISKEEIDNLIDKYGLVAGFEPNYFN